MSEDRIRLMMLWKESLLQLSKTFRASSPAVTSRRCLSHHGIERQLYISTCHDVFYNLALEDWICANVNLDTSHVLLLWRNDPCVVIGRHQNPWAECHVDEASERGVKVARRRSGGGAVFHDRGNVNCTFFTSRKLYDRPKNLNVITKALRAKWDLDVEVTPRDDILLDKQYKLSGTAAKLGRNTAFHHCTLIFDVDKNQLKDLLRPCMPGLQSKATASVPSPVKNLCEVEPGISHDDLVKAIGAEFLGVSNIEDKVVFCDPSNERMLPGVFEVYRELTDWDWIFGRTPPFSLRATLPEGGINTPETNLVVHIRKGRIDSIQLEGKMDLISDAAAAALLKELNDTLKGEKFSPGTLSSVMPSWIRELREGKTKAVGIEEMSGS